MNLREARERTQYLMKRHGLGNNWSFRWSRGRRLHGYAQYNERTKRGHIALSRFFVQLNTSDEIEDTILHEIAHALVGVGKGHSPAWKLKAIEIGLSNPQRVTIANMPEPKYFAVCACAIRHKRHRKSRRHAYFCRKCGEELRWKEK